MLLIFIIGFLIAAQNTCPYGWAAKTIFISPYASPCPHCPMKQEKQPMNSETQNDFTKDLSTINNVFMIHISKSDTVFQILSTMDIAFSIEPDFFRDVYLEPFFRPPVA